MSMSEAAPRQQLDLVKDCAELSGTFPANVELKFIFWAHGNVYDGESSAQKAARVAPALLEADYIGIEVAGTVHEDPRHVEQEFAVINSLLDKDNQHRKIRDGYGELQPTTALIDSIDLVMRLRKLGRTSTPQFFPFDIFENIAVSDIRSKFEYLTWDDYIISRARLMRHRENTAIRQFHAQATVLATDGQPHQIAILYGASHTAVSVATQALGAPTSRVFVDRPTIDMLGQYERAYRYKPAAAVSDSALEKLEVANSFGINLAAVAQLVKHKRANNNNGRIKSSAASTYTSLYTRASNKLMTLPQLLTFLDTTEAITETVSPQTELKYRQKRRVRAQLKQLDALAVELHMA